MTLKRARTPFRFYSRLALAAITGQRAKDAAELLEGVRTAPESVIYTHTHNFIRQHQFLAPEPPSDFALWASQILNDAELGERLAAVDTIRYATLEELRKALVHTLETHIKRRGASRSAPEGQEFPFMRSIRFSLPTPHTASDLAEFAEGLRLVSVSSFYLHVFEARLRPPLGVNDFSFWLETELGEKGLAGRIAKLDPYTHTIEGLRAAVLHMVRLRLEELSRG